MSHPYGNSEDSIFLHFLEETEFDLNEIELLSECCLNRDFIMT